MCCRTPPVSAPNSADRSLTSVRMSGDQSCCKAGFTRESAISEGVPARVRADGACEQLVRAPSQVAGIRRPHTTISTSGRCRSITTVAWAQATTCGARRPRVLFSGGSIVGAGQLSMNNTAPRLSCGARTVISFETGCCCEGGGMFPELDDEWRTFLWLRYNITQSIADEPPWTH
ncbi:hypothetical protein EDC20_1494 [Gluconobacter oxydans]|nr:hypothetical protein EDC20_1494 [Gluconobacter oxydans]